MSPRNFLPMIFSTLSRGASTSSPTTWTLLRTLKSENAHDMQGDLHGEATFTPSRASNPPSSSHKAREPSPNNATAAPKDSEPPTNTHTDLLYSESGSLPTTFGPGLRWTKKYIWRLADDKISVWFVTPETANKDGEEEADYLFHEFDFDFAADPQALLDSAVEEGFVNPPVPPEIDVPVFGNEEGKRKTRIIAARGNHLCVADMYRTAYAFRVCDVTGEVLSWASRHVVRGPKKGQDIVNLYSRA